MIVYWNHLYLYLFFCLPDLSICEEDMLKFPTMAAEGQFSPVGLSVIVYKEYYWEHTNLEL